MRFLLDLIENDDIEKLEESIHSSLSEIVMSKFNEKAQSYIFEEEQPTAEDVVGTIEDPVLDPTFSKEFFFKRFRFEDKEILLKRLGLGQNAPTVSYIDGERYELFSTPKQAEKETMKFIKDGSFDKMIAKKEAVKKEKAAAEKEKENAKEIKKQEEEDNHEKITESFQSILESDRPNIITLKSGEEKIVTVTEATHALEILKLLNNENGIKFLKRLSDSVTSYQDTMDFFLDRIRKGIY